MTGGAGAADRWFTTWRPRPEAPVRLYCLPFAGGGTNAFVGWPATLRADVEITAVALPGRERRVAEDPAVEPARIAEAIAAHADRPYALFGHSMGALVAFEAVRRLRATGSVLPVRLFAAGSPAPDSSIEDHVFGGLSRLEDSALLDRLVRDGALPAEVTREPELRELLLPVFRTDFGWLDDYGYTAQRPLPVPITAIAAQEDESAPPAEAARWSEHTAAGFELRVVSGGHFFLDSAVDRISEAVRDGLRTAASRLAST